jgi:hypothetical protein
MPTLRTPTRAELDSLSVSVAAANSEGFLWRKLTQSNAVEALRREHSQQELLSEIVRLLSEPSLDETQTTLVYCIAAAYLLKLDTQSDALSTLPNVDSVFWLRRLIAASARAVPSASRFQLNQGVIRQGIERSDSSNSSARFILAGE